MPCCFLFRTTSYLFHSGAVPPSPKGSPERTSLWTQVLFTSSLFSSLRDLLLSLPDVHSPSLFFFVALLPPPDRDDYLLTPSPDFWTARMVVSSAGGLLLAFDAGFVCQGYYSAFPSFFLSPFCHLPPLLPDLIGISLFFSSSSRWCSISFPTLLIGGVPNGEDRWLTFPFFISPASLLPFRKRMIQLLVKLPSVIPIRTAPQSVSALLFGRGGVRESSDEPIVPFSRDPSLG